MKNGYELRIYNSKKEQRKFLIELYNLLYVSCGSIPFTMHEDIGGRNYT